MSEKNTSWGAVADWYDEAIEGSSDSYQQKVILPNIKRLVDAKEGMNILDVACGQGFFARTFAVAGATVSACDISPELVKLAKERVAAGFAGTSKAEADSSDVNSKVKAMLESNPANKINFHVTPSDKLDFAKDATFDTVVIILALQNIEKLAETFAECSRVLKPNGRLVFVVNHPAYRIPQASSWQWDEKTAKQFRRVDMYMSDRTIKIDMTPGEVLASKKKYTVSFHRPLQSYFKPLHKAGFAVTRLEEWISHKTSQAGPRASEEDRIRKEIPMFLCLEATKL